LYFFHKQIAALAHSVTKESAVPNRDINLATRRKRRFEADPSKHTLEEN
jgi:hypothetical protein